MPRAAVAVAVEENIILHMGWLPTPASPFSHYIDYILTYVLCHFNLINAGGSWIGRGNRTEAQSGQGSGTYALLLVECSRTTSFLL